MGLHLEGIIWVKRELFTLLQIICCPDHHEKQLDTLEMKKGRSAAQSSTQGVNRRTISDRLLPLAKISNVNSSVSLPPCMILYSPDGILKSHSWESFVPTNRTWADGWKRINSISLPVWKDQISWVGMPLASFVQQRIWPRISQAQRYLPSKLQQTWWTLSSKVGYSWIKSPVSNRQRVQRSSSPPEHTRSCDCGSIAILKMELLGLCLQMTNRASSSSSSSSSSIVGAKSRSSSWSSTIPSADGSISMISKASLVSMWIWSSSSESGWAWRSGEFFSRIVSSTTKENFAWSTMMMEEWYTQHKYNEASCLFSKPSIDCNAIGRRQWTNRNDRDTCFFPSLQ